MSTASGLNNSVQVDVHMKGSQVEVYKGDNLWGVGTWNELGGYVKYLSGDLNPWMMDGIDEALRTKLGHCGGEILFSHPGELRMGGQQALDNSYERQYTSGVL